ncbi:MAG: hypothetical protein ABH863_05735 [Candidatus Micrarchaeota archaeon]
MEKSEFRKLIGPHNYAFLRELECERNLDIVGRRSFDLGFNVFRTLAIKSGLTNLSNKLETAYYGNQKKRHQNWGLFKRALERSHPMKVKKLFGLAERVMVHVHSRHPIENDVRTIILTHKLQIPFNNFASIVGDSNKHAYLVWGQKNEMRNIQSVL